MAAKRITQSTINWSALSERVPETQRSTFVQFKSKSDGYLRRMMSYPEKPPAINWEFYKSRVPLAGMVEDFQKQYASLIIPYPPNTLTSQIDAYEKEIKADIEEFKTKSAARIVEYKKQLDVMNAMLPFEEMTMEDFYDAYPDRALYPHNKPTYWPHREEDQIEYYEKHYQPSADH